jgi:hypothetical protein
MLSGSRASGWQRTTGIPARRFTEQQCRRVEEPRSCRDLTEQLGDNAVRDRHLVSVAALQFGKEVPKIQFPELYSSGRVGQSFVRNRADDFISGAVRTLTRQLQIER